MSDISVDYKEILAKYIAIVVKNEGVTFLYKREWDDKEWAAMQEAEAIADEIIDGMYGN